MIRAIVILILLSIVKLSFGQDQGKTSLLSVNDGLSQGLIFDVHQSRDGFLWIATKDGLNRYDGYRFEVFANDSFDPFSIVSNEVWKIFEDSRGRLWVVCREGLDLFLPITGRFLHILPDMPGMNGDMVSFVEMPDGTIWLTVTGKCWKIEIPPGQLEKAIQANNAFPDLPITEVQIPNGLCSTIFLTEKGSLLLGSTQGLFRILPENNTLQPLALSGRPVRVFGQDRQGNVWIDAIAPDLTGLYLKEDCGGLWLWSEEKETLRSIPCLPYGRHKFGPDGSLWTWPSMGKTFSKWQPATFINGGVPEMKLTCDHEVTQNQAFYIRTVDFDRSGIVWLGTSGFGLLKMSAAPLKFSSHLERTTQRLITEDPQGRIFALGFRHTAYTSPRFDHAVPNPWATPFDPVDDRSTTVFDEQGNAWINSSRDSLFRIDANTRSLRYLPWKGLGLIRSRNGKLLTVQEDGLLQFDPVTEQRRLIPFDLPPASPLTFHYSHFLYEDPTGTVWIFAFKGLIEAAPKGDTYQYRYYKTDPANRGTLSEDYVLSVAADPLEPGRYLWIGTKGGGLNRLDRQTGAFQHYKKKEGLPDNVVYGILPDDQGHLWLSTNRGLCRFHVRQETTRNFTAADGLQSNEFNQSSYLRTRDGYLIFGGVNGLTVFHPDSLQFNKSKPTTTITRVWINNEIADNSFTKSPLTLSYHQNLVTIEMAALEFSNPAQNQYRYQLRRQSFWGSPPETNWVDLGTDNRVQFANLRPGHYAFRALGSNNDGVWGEQPALLQFTIQPPWWAAWWAYVLYALAVGGLVLLAYRYQLRQRLQLQEARRLKELDDFKNRFFTNITHEFRTPLTVILGVANQLQRESSASGKPIALIRRSGENLLRLINQLLDLAKLESRTLKINYVQGDVVAYLQYITESLHSLANARNLLLSLERQPDSYQGPIVMDYDPERLQQVVYNLLSNAIKFTPSGGRVKLLVQVKALQGAKLLELRVIDTGIGIAPEDLPLIFDRFSQASNLEKAKAGGTGIGLALTKELVKAMGGDIKVESEVGRGTTFTLHLPVSNRAEMVEPDNLLKAAPESDLLTAAHRPDPSSAKPSVLLVEDNPDVVEYLASCLQGTYALEFAYNGRAGIEIALEKVPSLIISDVMMPEKDGFELCETLKQDERTSHIPIVLLTAKAGVEHRISGLRRGADAYLAKPFHEQELLATLENLLTLRQKLQEKYRGLAFAKDESLLSIHQESDPEHAFLQKARAIVLEHLSDSSFSVKVFCQSMTMSQPQLHRKLTALTGKNATQFIRSIRLAKANELLLATEKSVSEVAYEVGFSDPKYFSRVFSDEFGVPPSKI